MQLQTAKHEGPQNQAESAHTCLRFVKRGTIVSKRWQRKFYRREAMKPPVHAVRDLGQAIKRLRLQREMTQQELADASGLDIRDIGSIERGIPTSATLPCTMIGDTSNIPLRTLGLR